MKRIVALIVGAIVASLLVVVPSAPASADTGVCAGAGTITLGGGLYFPLLGPKRTLPFTLALNVAGICVTEQGTKTLNAVGTVNGYCGLAYGRGAAFGLSGPFDFSFFNVGALLIFTGHISGAAVVMVAPGQSCLPTGPGASQFVFAGAVGKSHVVPPVVPPFKFPPKLPAACPNAPSCP